MDKGKGELDKNNTLCTENKGFGHCWHDSPEMRGSMPAQYVQQCCYCDKERSFIANSHGKYFHEIIGGPE